MRLFIERKGMGRLLFMEKTGQKGIKKNKCFVERYPEKRI